MVLILAIVAQKSSNYSHNINVKIPIQTQSCLCIYNYYSMLKLLVFVLFNVYLLGQKIAPKIISISSSPNSIVAPVYSSLRGGALVYIKAIGHNPISGNNLVYVGNYPCNIPSDGVTDTFITCETSDSGSQNNIYNLQVSLIAYGMSFTTSYPNVVHYTQSYTPYLDYVFPSASYASNIVNLDGYHKISDLGDGRQLGDVVAIKLGKDMCSRFDIVQAAIDPQSLQTISCAESSLSEAGKYNVSEKLTPGYAQNSPNLRRSSLIKGEYFQFTVLPTVASISPSSGNLGGQKITIEGTGFSVNPANVSVTVDNNICQVTSSSATQISCTLASRNTSLTSKLSTNSTNQANPYLSGVGLNYARYAPPTSLSMSQFVSAVRINNTGALGTPLEASIRTQIREPDVHGVYYAQVWRGYFTAPVTGIYDFRGLADDVFAVYLSSNYGSTEPGSSPLIYSNQYQFYEDFYYGYRSTAQGYITLEGGKSYYIEAYHMNVAGGGFFTLYIDVPNSDKTLPFQSYEVLTITTSATLQPEVVTYSMVGGSSGYINLHMYRVDSSSGQVTYNVNQKVNYGCSASDFQSALNYFDSFSSYGISVTRNIYDTNNQTLSTTASAARIDYVVSINLLRPTNVQAQSFIVTYHNYSGVFISTATTAHSPLIGGTWTLSVGGVTISPYNNINLGYDADPGYIMTGLRSIVGFEQVQVSQYFRKYAGFGYGSTWLIKFVGYFGTVPNLIVNGAGLTGGSTTPKITVSVLHNFSTSVTFQADYRFFNTYSAVPNVLVTVNGLLAVCLSNCGYTFVNITQVNALNLYQTTLNLNLNTNALVNVSTNNVTITVNGFSCSINSQTNLSSLNCSLHANNGSTTPILVAGYLYPLIFINLIGFVQLASGVSPILVPLIASSLSTSTGGNNGGYLVTLNGQGFPLKITQASISVCSNTATIKSITNTQVIFYMPACSSIGQKTISLTVGTLTNTNLSFAYTNSSLLSTTPTITSISPTSSNPAIKAVLNITGTNFGSDVSVVSVFLSNSSGKVYQLSILYFNSTYIRAGLSGGLAGNFIVQVGIPSTVGDSIAATVGSNTFSYSVVINSISPQTGSYNGGTLITITGQNFSPATSDTLVYIGEALNWFCSIQKITTTQIQCLTPPIGLYSVGSAKSVVVSTKLVIFDTCSGNCTFTYLSAASSPNINNISTNSANVQNVTLTGTSFTNGGTFTICKVSLTNSDSSVVTIVPTVTCNDKIAVFTVSSSIVAGNYKVQLVNDIGQSNPKSLFVNWVPGNPSYSSGGSVAGAIVTFTGGSGYPASIVNPFYIFVTSSTTSYPTVILSCCTGNSLTMVIPPSANSTVIKITFNSPANPTNPPTKTYTSSLSKTPTASITSAKIVAQGLINIQLNRTSTVTSTILRISLVSVINSKMVISIGNWSTNGTTTNFNAVLTAGSYNILINSAYGYYQCSDILNVQLPNNIAAKSQVASFAGGIYTINGNLSPSSYILVNGLKGQIINYTSSAVTYMIPPLVTPTSNAAFGLAAVSLIDMGSLTYFSDQNASTSNVISAFDGLINTVYNSTNIQCWIGMDIGSGLYAYIQRIRFFPSLQWTNTANYILYAVFEGSNDQSTWTTLGKIDQTVHSGYNTIISLSSNPFRYIRFRHNSTSMCNIAEIQLYGIVYSNINVNLASQISDVIYQDGYNNYTTPNGIQYRSDHTPIVQTVTPPYGNIFGGYTITISGTNLGFDIPSVVIDGIQCVNVTYGSSSIKCTVGARPNLPSSNSFNVSIGSKIAIIQSGFLYVLRWSDSSTWGVDLPPVDGDLVYVPQGMTLLIDQSTPVLAGITAQNGTIIFSDDTDIVVQAGFITVVGGQFLAGTQAHPYSHHLTFIMHGNYYATQQPMFGNKGIGCLQCKFSIYGMPRNPTWTTLAATVYPGDNILTVSQDIDWQVGQQIVIASTSFLHYEAQQMTIIAVNGRTITVNSPFVYKHVSVIQTYGNSDYLVMKAEVGLLTRNIKVQGDTTTSTISKYGAHLMLAGQAINGLEGHIAYTQFYYCGQPQILGRYCIHFHMNGEVPTSYVRGNSVHHSFARVVTLHGLNFLTVEFNVGYRVSGHNYFVEDGIQTNNVIRYNLAISSLTATNMLQTDISVASFWVTNPTNDFYGNHAAGGDFYGIWYEIKQHPDGPSATNDVCPIGNPLGKVYNNTAHSNIRFGFRLLKLYARQYPCQSIRNNSDGYDPWFYNPSITSNFTNFTLYKNMQDGALAEQPGDLVLDQFVVAESYNAGVEFYMANFTQKNVMLFNSVIIGVSQTNAASDPTNYSLGMAGVITPRTGASNITKVRFYNFPVGSILFIICSQCDTVLLFTNVGTQVFLQQLTFNQINGNYLQILGLSRDMVFDTDASLAPLFDGITRKSATIVSNFPHIAAFETGHCVSSNQPAKWNNTIMCDQTITIRRVMFTGLTNPADFNQQPLKATRLNTINQLTSLNINSSLYTSIVSYMTLREPMDEIKHTWSMPYVTGRIYNIWWGIGIDFMNMSISTTPIFGPNDLGIIFKFNYTTSRELFSVGPIIGGVPFNNLNQIAESSGYWNPSTCSNGDYYHNNAASSLRMLSVCQSGKNRALFQYIHISAIYCQFACPAATGTFSKQNFIRRWSNATQWPNGTVPQAGQNVTVNGNWTVLMDVDPAPAAYLIIDGTLVFDDSRNVNITADSIFIRAGNVTVGSPSAPFQHNLTIRINGLRQDSGYIVDAIVSANKFFVVTGSLNLYGIAPRTVTTCLTKTALKGSSTIYVASSTDWKVGDTIALAPSFSNALEYETATIQSINSDGSITLTQALNYTHFGDSSITISNSYGQLDTRAQVGHLNRNIQIVAGPDYGWGFTLIVHGFMDGTIHRVGNVNLMGVQFLNGGQQDTQNSALVFLNTVNGNYTSSVTSTSFVNCMAYCVNLNNANNITMTNNVLYNGWIFGVYAQNMHSFTFTNNLIIGIVDRPDGTQNADIVACFAAYTNYIDPVNDQVFIQNNICQGSTGHGFAFPHILCNELNTHTMGNNTAGSCFIGFIFNKIPGTCMAASWIRAYACSIAQMVDPPNNKEMIFSNFMIADSQRGLSLKFGSDQSSTNHTLYIYNSYITAVSRPSCSLCYGSSATICSNGTAARMFSVTVNGQTMPSKSGSNFDVFCKQQVFDAKAYLYNVIFDSYRQTYTGAIANLCSNNFVFKTYHDAIDYVAGHNLFNCSCTNCDTSSYALCDPNLDNQLGWFGGCGDILCTGKQNYLIHDFTGSFFPFKGIIIPNNPTIGNNQPNCIYSSIMNAHLCQREDFATLQYQSIAPDYASRIMWPVSLTYEGSNYTTLTNGFREWLWVGLQPQNTRRGRFYSIVRLQSVYNMSFTAQPPGIMQLQIQKRTPLGNSSNYVIIKLQYGVPNTIQSQVNGVTMPPIMVTDSGPERPINTSICGDNIYFYNNRTIYFVVNQDLNCLVTISLVESIQLTTHFAMSVSQFYTNTVMSSYIDNLCALLKITDFSRVKIVGVYTGSIAVVSTISPPTDSSSPPLTQTSALIDQSISNGVLASNLSAAVGNFPVLNLQSVHSIPVFTSTNNSSSSSSNSNSNNNSSNPNSNPSSSFSTSSKSSFQLMGLIIGVIIGVISIGIILTIFCCIRKRRKISEYVRTSDQLHQEEYQVQRSKSLYNFHKQLKSGSQKSNELNKNSVSNINFVPPDEIRGDV